MLTASPEGVGRKRGGLARSVRSRILSVFFLGEIRFVFYAVFLVVGGWLLPAIFFF